LNEITTSSDLKRLEKPLPARGQKRAEAYESIAEPHFDANSRRIRGAEQNPSIDLPGRLRLRSPYTAKIFNFQPFNCV
jgi:hypothetical protein